MNTPGKSSRIVTTKYGKVLSSTNRVLNGGRVSLIKRDSIRRASHSPSHSMVSMASILASIGCFLGPNSADGTKYDETRFLRLPALPTYRTCPFTSFIKYTPGRSGRALAKPKDGGDVRPGLLGVQKGA